MMSDIYAEKPWLKNYDPNVPPTLEYEEKTFAEKFLEMADRYPDKTALIYMGNHITFRDIDLLSNQLAAYLIKSGVKPDDVVGLCMPNLPANYISIVAVQKAGAVSTGLSPLLTPVEMEHQIKDSRTKVVITVDLLYGIVAQAALRELGLDLAVDDAGRLLEATYISGVEGGKAPFPDARRTLLTLRERGFLLGAVTNRAFGGERFRADLRDAGLEIDWDVEAVSVEVGFLKPHPAMFEYALAHLKIGPADALMVGNSLAEDVLGAQMVGIRAAWRRSADRSPG